MRNALAADVTFWKKSTIIDEALYSEVQQYLASDVIDAAER